MATDPIPEPLTNQDLREDSNKVDFRRSTATPELPPAPERNANTRLKEAAAKAGHTAGRTVAAVREMPRRAQDSATQAESSTSAKIEEIKNRASQAADQAREKLTETYDETKQQAAATYRRTRVRAMEFLDRARARSRQIVDDYPLHIIAGAALAGVVVGVLLRIWRSSRYE